MQPHIISNNYDSALKNAISIIFISKNIVFSPSPIYHTYCEC